MRKFYGLIDHTADIGIKIKSRDLAGLFKKAARAMFDIMAEKKAGGNNKEKLLIEEKADNLEELLVRWLNELLSLSAVRELIFTRFEIHKLDKNNLRAEVIGSDMKNYKVATEIKAATYHELEIKKRGPWWQAQVIFDV